MALRKKEEFWYGDNLEDLRDELVRYSQEGYPINEFAQCICKCGSDRFAVAMDDLEGVAARLCLDCEDEHVMGDGGDYMSGAELTRCTCVCDKDEFQVLVGINLHSDSGGPLSSVRWFYLGCRCTHCGLVACFGDWKNEYDDWEDLLNSV